jgi:predicted nucleic acid-binding protein
VTLNRYVLDANVLVSAVLSPSSTANQAYQKALDTGLLGDFWE